MQTFRDEKSLFYSFVVPVQSRTFRHFYTTTSNPTPKNVVEIQRKFMQLVFILRVLFSEVLSFKSLPASTPHPAMPSLDFTHIRIRILFEIYFSFK